MIISTKFDIEDTAKFDAITVKKGKLKWKHLQIVFYHRQL